MGPSPTPSLRGDVPKRSCEFILVSVCTYSFNPCFFFFLYHRRYSFCLDSPFRFCFLVFPSRATPLFEIDPGTSFLPPFKTAGFNELFAETPTSQRCFFNRLFSFESRLGWALFIYPLLSIFFFPPPSSNCFVAVGTSLLDFSLFLGGWGPRFFFFRQFLQSPRSSV